MKATDVIELAESDYEVFLIHDPTKTVFSLLGVSEYVNDEGHEVKLVRILNHATLTYLSREPTDFIYFSDYTERYNTVEDI